MGLLSPYAIHCRTMAHTTKPVVVGKDRNGDPIVAPVPTDRERELWLQLAAEAEARGS